MKKKNVIAILLIGVLCVGLCACNSSEPNPEEVVLGQWYFDDPNPTGVNDNSGTLVIEEEGQGTFTYHNETIPSDVQWAYDEDAGQYEVIIEGSIFTGDITNVEGEEILNLSGLEFARITPEE